MSTTLVQALDRIANNLGSGPLLKQLGPGPYVASGPYEEVLCLNSPVTITLKSSGGTQYFSSTGSLFDFSGQPRGTVSTALPTSVTPQTAGYLLTFPPPQPPPFDTLPVVTGSGPLPPGEIPPGSYTKQLYDFGNGDTLVMEGPAFPKLTYLDKGGNVQFWVGFIGAITQGTGKYKGARGMASFDGSAYFASFPPPTDFNGILATLEAGFPANVSVCIKTVGGAHVLPPPVQP